MIEFDMILHPRQIVLFGIYRLQEALIRILFAINFWTDMCNDQFVDFFIIKWSTLIKARFPILKKIKVGSC